MRENEKRQRERSGRERYVKIFRLKFGNISRENDFTEDFNVLSTIGKV